MANELLNVMFFKASINDTTIYVKTDSSIHEELFNVLHDFNYKVARCSGNDWGDKIESGMSYEIDTLEEIEEFIEINNKAKKIQNNE